MCGEWVAWCVPSFGAVVRVVVVGAGGQVGSAVVARFPGAVGFTHTDLDVTDSDAVWDVDWSGFDVLVNAAGVTNAEECDRDPGRCWAVNAAAVQTLVGVAESYGMRFVHFSSDYVFDGTKPVHNELEGPSPVNLYGAAKAAGDMAALGYPLGLVLRLSWVVGDGRNFVRTIHGRRDEWCDVVDDQWGRLTFAVDVVEGIARLLDAEETGLFNLTNSGPVATWRQISRHVSMKTIPVTTDQYALDHPGYVRRPPQSGLALDKLINTTGWVPPDWRDRLTEYVGGL